MSLTTHQKLARVALDMRQLQSVTGALGWDQDDRSGDDGAPMTAAVSPGDMAKPIPSEVWMRAFLTAMKVMQAVGIDVPIPIPGADPAGFVWLTWKSPDERRGLALELRQTGMPYVWTMRSPDIDKTTIQSDGLEDVVEALRQVFRGALVVERELPS